MVDRPPLPHELLKDALGDKDSSNRPMNERIVDFPTLRGDNPMEVVMNFYSDLGKDEGNKVNPTKVIVAEDKGKEMIQKLRDTVEPSKKRRAQFLFVNYGPSTDKHKRMDIDEDKVVLQEGWQVED